MKPKGILLIIGGAEDKGENEFLDEPKYLRHVKRYEILKELLKVSKNKHIEIITSASEIPGTIKKLYQKAFHKIHYPNPGFISIRKKDEADNPLYLDRIRKAGAVFFTGGDQRRLVRVLNNTKLIDIIKEKYKNECGFLIAGTSAGAMALSTDMITGGGKKEALFHHDLELAPGLNILPSCIVDTHFIKRGRFSRLAHAVVLYPKRLGIGLGEDTALIIKNGTEAECRGSGMVIIIDGRYITRCNIRTVKTADPIYVNNLHVHLLIRGCRFSFQTKKLCRPQRSIADKNIKKNKKIFGKKLFKE